MNSIVHNYSHVAGKTLFWDTSDSQQRYFENLKDPEKKKMLQEMGFLDRPIEYRFNSHGFRTHEFDQKFDAVCFGCSFTMGTGIHIEHSWPSQLEIMTNLKIANLAHSGSSNDTAYRMAEHYLNFFKPKFAFWLQTDKHRIEIVNDQDQKVINIMASDSDDWYSNNYFIKTWMVSDSNQDLNLKKNTRAFVNLCGELEIVPIILPRSAVIDEDLARDLQHPGQNSYYKLAQKFKEMILS